MEIEGHPTQDLIEELERRGARRVPGGSAGPDAEALAFIAPDGEPHAGGFWLFLPEQTFMTGMDELPGV
ncbi:MAG: hypothetical protein GEU71_13200 [Actinobacteria bacterium]|jgi:hypothetical protein|nr:hypothetical protein [Actinomycetota bacterium]